MKLRGFVSAHLLLYVLLVVSCVTPYQPDTVSISSGLVVEGEITDQPGPYTVKLTRTADYSFKSLNLLETGATVTISDNQGHQEILREQSTGGIYQTGATGLRGVVGQIYKVTIKTKNGKVYESAPERLSAAPPIQKLYYDYSIEPTGTTYARRQGWNVYLDTKDPEATGNYYRWTWTHYEPVAACQVTYTSKEYIGLSCCSACWDIARCYTCTNVSSDVNINGQAISHQSIARVPYTSLSPYYIEVQQQAISAGAYAFWKSVRQLTANTGGLFDAAPALVEGNIRCVSDPAALAYGFFGATGLSEQYLVVNRSAGQGVPDLPTPVRIPFPSNCYPCENSLYRTPNKPRWWPY